MKIKTLKRNRKYFYMGIICGVILLSILVFNVSRAKYKSTESIELARGTINYTVPDLNLVSMYVNDNGEYKGTDTVPQSGYKLNQEKSYCTINGNKESSIIIDYNNGKLNVNNLTKKGTKCYLYFDKLSAKDTLAKFRGINSILTRTDFSTILSTDTTGTIYSAADDYGTSYYFAGNPTDNWVKFAGFYWRIIRINGDGTIRMIYQGDSANTTGTGTQIGTSTFNSNYNDNMYVGYQYTNNEVHGRGTDSNIKGVLDSWYNSNLNSYSEYIATGEGATFCNDRLTYFGTGLDNTDTFYAPRNRLFDKKDPSFKCQNDSDKFDVSIGLVTADEVAYAGGVCNINNQSYYLNTNQQYWTISPGLFYNGNVYMFNVYSDGTLNGYYTNNFYGVRPVINLKADVNFSSGNGTNSDPFLIS